MGWGQFIVFEVKGAFSPHTIKALADVITGGSANDNTPPIGHYRSGPKIEQFFMDCNLEMRIGSASRLPATLDRLRQINDEDNGFQAIKSLLEHVANPCDYIDLEEKHQAVLDHLNKRLSFDGYSLQSIGNKCILVNAGNLNVAVDDLYSASDVLDFDAVRENLNRALQAAEHDPEDAITAACSMLESVCRSIIIETGNDLPSKMDISSLMGAIQEVLNLSPSRSDLPQDIAQDIKMILGGLISTAKGVGALEGMPMVANAATNVLTQELRD
jgi:hypothetical protein